MTWWLVSRRWWVVALTAAGTLAVGYGLGELALPTPGRVVRLETPPQLVFLVPIGLALAIAAILPRERTSNLERAPSRWIGWYDAGLVLAVSSLVVATAAGIHLLAGWERWDLFARNTIGYLGVALIARVVLAGLLAGLATTMAVVILPAFFGVRWDGTPRWWAWPLFEQAELGVVVQVTVVFVTGTLLLVAGVREGALLRLLRRIGRSRPRLTTHATGRRKAVRR